MQNVGWAFLPNKNKKYSKAKMKKIVRQQNYLKELIDSQENRFLSRQALRCVIRGVLEPLLDKPEEAVVLHRIIDKAGILGLLKRLEFSEIEDIDYSDDSENLREKVWAGTEFLCVLTHRFVAILIWDNKTESEHTVRYYSIYNSKLQNEALDIINRNSIFDLRQYQESFKPDRRDNILLNSSIRRLVENMDESSKDAVLKYAEIQTYKTEKTDSARAVAHEIKNQLSICDLYTEIIRKYCKKNDIEADTIENALNCLNRAVKIASNSLVALKATDGLNLKPHNLKSIIDNAVDLTKVYFECKNINYEIENNVDKEILVDENNFIAVLINLVKNAVEAFGENVGDGKYIKIKTEEDGESAIIRIRNNAERITQPDMIFEEGFTTKKTGSGLGLSICKKSIEEQAGLLKLAHSGDDYTEFVIKIGLV